MSLETFLKHFYQEYNEINDKLNSLTKIDTSSPNEHELKLQLSADYESISNRTVILQKYFTENTNFIPQYEIRKAQEHLAKLGRASQDKRDEVFPKKKFGFKSKQNMTTLETAISTAIISNDLKQEKKAELASDEDLFYKDSTCTIKDQDNVNIIKYEDEINGKDIGILNVKNSCIQLQGWPSVLHAKNIENTVILCGPISGSAFVNNLRNVKLVIACHQLRIHETHNSQFYIHLGSRAIIENCSQVTFAPYAWSYPKLDDHFRQSGLNVEQSNWTCIDDFNWLNQTQKSPNWSFASDEQKSVKWTTDETGQLKTN